MRLLTRDVPFERLEQATRVGCENDYGAGRGADLPRRILVLWADETSLPPELDDPTRMIMLNSWRMYLGMQRDDDGSPHLRALVAALVVYYRRGYTLDTELQEFFRAVASLGPVYCMLAADLLAWEAQSRRSSYYEDTELLYLSLLGVAFMDATKSLARFLKEAQQQGSKLHWCDQWQCRQWRQMCMSSGGILDAVAELDSSLPHAS